MPNHYPKKKKVKAKIKRVLTGTDTYHNNEKYRDGNKEYVYDTYTERGKKKYKKRIKREQSKARRKNKRLIKSKSKSYRFVTTPDDGPKSVPPKNYKKVKYKQALLNKLKIN